MSENTKLMRGRDLETYATTERETARLAVSNAEKTAEDKAPATTNPVNTIVTANPANTTTNGTNANTTPTNPNGTPTTTTTAGNPDYFLAGFRYDDKNNKVTIEDLYTSEGRIESTSFQKINDIKTNGDFTGFSNIPPVLIDTKITGGQRRHRNKSRKMKKTKKSKGGRRSSRRR